MNGAPAIPVFPTKLYFEPKDKTQMYKTFIITVTVSVGAQAEKTFTVTRKLDPCPTGNLIAPERPNSMIIRTGNFDER